MCMVLEFFIKRMLNVACTCIQPSPVRFYYTTTLDANTLCMLGDWEAKLKEHSYNGQPREEWGKCVLIVTYSGIITKILNYMF